MASQNDWILRCKRWNVKKSIIVYESDQRSELGVISNISHQNVLCTGVVEVASQAHLMLWVEIRDTCCFRAAARCIWHQYDDLKATYYTGIEFLAVNTENFQQLQKAIDPKLLPAVI